MTFGQILKIAWEGLMLNRVRSVLTTLGVIIGVASVIMMLAISAGAEAEIADQINGLGANLLFIMPQFSFGGAGGGPPNISLTVEDAEAIASSVYGIEGVSAENSTTQIVSVTGVTLSDISIIGSTADFPEVRDYAVAEGRYFTAEENDRKNKVAVLGSSVAEELFGEQSPLGQTINIGSTRFTIIGVMEEKGSVGGTDFDARVYIPVTVLNQKFQTFRLGGESVRTIYVEVKSRDAMENVTAQVTALLTERHGVTSDEPDFTFMTQQDIIETQQSTTEVFRNLLAWVAGVSLVVGGIGIMNIMLVSVTERTREIGLRQAIGARPNAVMMQFLLEAVILSLIGGLLGVAFGVGGSYLFDMFGGLRTVVVPESIPLAFLAAASVGIFFGYYPATQAAQLDPIEALRHE